MVVIDNSSSDKVHDVAGDARLPLCGPGPNLGFAAGVNRALAELGPAHGDVLLLNPDAQVDGAGGARVAERRCAPPATNASRASSPSLTRDDGSAERVRMAVPDTGRALARGDRARLAAAPDPAFSSAPCCCSAAKRSTTIGAFDERFFLYAEETDWQRRAANAGWSGLACTELPRVAYRSRDQPLTARRREAMFHAASERYIRKWYGTQRLVDLANGLDRGGRGAVDHRPEPEAATDCGCSPYLRGPQRWEQRNRQAGVTCDRRVVHVVCTANFAGVERYVTYIAPRLARRGWEVTVIGGDADRMRASLGDVPYVRARLG